MPPEMVVLVMSSKKTQRSELENWVEVLRMMANRKL